MANILPVDVRSSSTPSTTPSSPHGYIRYVPDY
jgi:hypothetical protein